MHKYSIVRGRLEARRNTLLSRLDCIERHATSRGYSCRSSGSAGDSPSPILQAYLEPTRSELALAESAIRRIDDREFGYCISCGSEIPERDLERLPYTVNCADCSESFPDGYASDLEFQHTDLREMTTALLAGVAEVCKRLQNAEAVAEERCAFIAMLMNFCRELPEHFVHEEDEGYREAQLQTDAELQREVAALILQHRTLSSRIHSIHDRLVEAEDRSIAWSEAQHRLRCFMHDLLAHEEAEKNILSR